MKGLYIIHRGKDLLIHEFETELASDEGWIEFVEILEFHFEERNEPTKDSALFFKENYFEKESEDTWDTLDIIEI